MSGRLRALITLGAFLAFTGVVYAQGGTSSAISGVVVDSGGGVIPGAAVTIKHNATGVTTESVSNAEGVFSFPGLPIGTYTVMFELSGFRTISFPDIRVTIGFRAQVDAAMELSTVVESVTVTGSSPLLDSREAGTKATFDIETMQNIPSARDPWVMLERAPGIVMDRANVGGNQSGQQSNYKAKGAQVNQNTWNMDGVTITDMAALGSSPTYYDFDMFQEMQVTTGGADVTTATPGVHRVRTGPAVATTSLMYVQRVWLTLPRVRSSIAGSSSSSRS